jgi:polyisoprenyl-teichoic acid--peptidoglycan teichoic acid transferase
VETQTDGQAQTPKDADPQLGAAAQPGDEPVVGIGRSRSPVVAAFLSFLFPGLGHLLVGRRRSAVVFLVPALLAVGWFAVQLHQGWTWFGLSLFDETFAATLISIAVLLGAWRIAAVAHSFLVARPGGRKRKWEMAVAAALIVSIVAVHGAAVYGAWSVYHAGDAMNTNLDLSDASLAGPKNPDASPEVTPYQSMGPRDTTSYPISYVPTPTPTPLPTYPVNDNRITFALLGVDFMTGRSHALTDTMMVATLDVHTNKATILSIPRDTAGFELYYGGWVPNNFRLNTLMTAAASKSFGSPDSGVQTIEKELGFLTGLPVDYYVAVDLEGFVQLVNAIGGIDVDVKVAVNDPFTGTFVPVGMNHMDGHLALKYCRSRESTSDYARAARQEEVLTVLAHKVITPEVLTNLPDILTLAGKTISTDFPMKYARNFPSAFRRVGQPYKCVLGPPYSFHPDSSTTGGSWVSVLDIHRVANLSVWLFGPESTYYGREGVVPAPCGT